MSVDWEKLQKDSKFKKLMVQKRASWLFMGIFFVFQVPLIPNLYAACAAYAFAFLIILFYLRSEIYVLFCHAVNRNEKLTALAFISGYGIALLFCFSGLYYYFGIVSGDTIIKHDWQTSIYFSIVTWTTLGYGDLHPIEGLRIVAAVEALIGYIFMGLTIGVVISILSTPKDKKQDV